MGEAYRPYAGTIPDAYERYLGPLLFEPYAKDLVARLAIDEGARVLELACGTGILTNRLRAAMPARGTLVATDLSDGMLAVAEAKLGRHEALSWQQADAGALPFADRAFDLVVCQFGLMFFPDKLAALREVRRVLCPGGRFVANTWGSIADNEAIRVLVRALADDTRFFDVPFGMHDPAGLRSLLTDASFVDVAVTSVSLVGLSPTAHDAARGLLCGTPAYYALINRGADVERVVQHAATVMGEVLGDAPLRAKMLALVVSGRRPTESPARER